MVLAASADDTVLTEWFSDGWPNAPHRVLRSSVAAAQKTGWRATVLPYRGVERDPSDMAMYAAWASATSAAACRRPKSSRIWCACSDRRATRRRLGRRQLTGHSPGGVGPATSSRRFYVT